MVCFATFEAYHYGLQEKKEPKESEKGPAEGSETKADEGDE